MLESLTADWLKKFKLEASGALEGFQHILGGEGNLGRWMPPPSQQAGYLLLPGRWRQL